MKPLFILIFAFLIALLFFKKSKKTYQYAQAGQIAMSIMLIFTAIGHFVFSEGMAMMLPDLFPMKMFLVYATGFLEIAFAIGLFVSRFRIITAWLLILFLISVLPVNINASIQHINYQNATFDGHGLHYLWFRIPLQIFFISWIYFFIIKTPKYTVSSIFNTLTK